MNGAALAFTAHNIVLPNGSQTFPYNEPIADNGICQAALRDLSLVFSDSGRRWVKVADLGCLEGGYAAAFARTGYDVTGFEARLDNFLCCKYVEEQIALPNLRFIRADVRDMFTAPGNWDAVFCCGLLYHLEDPVAFLQQLGRATRRLLIVQTHYSTRPDAEHEGHRGHWYAEGNGRWASWKNERSFWLTKKDLLTAMRDAGFNLVFEQSDYLDDITAEGVMEPDARGMFVGIKVNP